MNYRCSENALHLRIIKETINWSDKYVTENFQIQSNKNFFVTAYQTWKTFCKRMLKLE